MEHLSLEIFDRDGKGSQYAYLAEDASITFTDTSEIFSSGDVWSFPFSLNTVANAKIFGTSGEIHGSRLHEQLNGRRARVWVDGLPLYLGYLKLDSEVDVDDDGNVDATFESGQKTFDELIEGGKANQVPMLGEVQFGMALWRKRWTCMQMQLTAKIGYEKNPTYANREWNDNGEFTLTHEVHSAVIGDEDEQLTYFISDGEEDGTSVQLYPRMVFPKGTFYNMATSKEETVDFLNTDNPYDDSHPYCNIALCYQKYGYTVTTESNGVKYTHEDYSSDPTAQRGYEVMPANRVNSAPNFFVIYWIKALMAHLGIHIDENQMMEVEDLRRLFFVNTNCAYEETKYLRDPSKYTGTYGRYQFGSKGPLVSEYFGDLAKEKYQLEQKRWNGIKNLAKIENCGLECVSFTEGTWYEKKVTVSEKTDGTEETIVEYIDATDTVKNIIGSISGITITPKAIAGMSEAVRAYYDGYGSAGYGSNRLLQKNLLLHRAIASSECFPDEDISTVIDALESGFGIRFLFDKSYKRVRIVLLKNFFRNSNVQSVACDILSETKTENCIRGFKMSYGNSEDTTFYYKGFNDLLPHKKELWVDKSDKHDYSYWNLNAKYADLLNKVSAFDKTCYIEPATGNAYGIKVDEDAKRYDELYPSLFEFAGFMDAEDGDCTGEDETIETVEVGFKPAVMNDVNYENERNPQKAKEQHFALFVDETMRPRRPDLNDLPNDKQPGVKSYDDSDAVYSTDKLYERHGNNGTDAKMVSDGVVAPGSFAVASDMYVEKTFPSLPLSVIYTIYGGWGQYSQTNFCTTLTNVKISGHISEGYRLYLQDNFEVNDDGVCPIESHEWGLTLGIMRGSGSDAYVDYINDPRDEEGNDTWDIVPGSSATAHPDICNNYGELWDYNGTLHVSTSADAKAAIEARYPTTADSILVARSAILVQELADAGWTVSGDMSRKAKYFYYKLTINSQSKGYVTIYTTPIATQSTESSTGKRVYTQKELKEYILDLWSKYSTDLVSYDTNKVVLAVAPSDWSTLAYLRGIYFGYSSEKDFDNGVGATDGRFSLKLRAEKLNPYYVKGSTEEGKSNQYLPITTDALKGRGLMDKFYKEYSYWTRNARIVKLTTRMTLAQFLAIDKTERVRMGDYLGFIKKMEFSVSNKTGFSNVTIELMYI